MVMIAAYNLYLGGFLPEVSPKNSIHNKRELKNKYKHLDEITLEFLDDRYKFRKNGDRMILISVNKI